MQTIVQSKFQHTGNNIEKSRKKQKQGIQNTLLASYLNNSGKSLPSSVSQKNHKKAIMEILNSGGMKELQFLPGIGKKTAYEIVSKRTVKGKFESLDDIKKTLMMKDTSWNKFLEVCVVV
jgi:DNA uptake protein ComE-like DNA-binding protein